MCLYAIVAMVLALEHVSLGNHCNRSCAIVWQTHTQLPSIGTCKLLQICPAVSSQDVFVDEVSHCIWDISEWPGGVSITKFQIGTYSTAHNRHWHQLCAFALGAVFTDATLGKDTFESRLPGE